MPKKPDRIISWHRARCCWRKKYKGQTHYLATGGVCKGENDLAGYEIALGEWFDIKRRADAAKTDQPALALATYGEPLKLPLKKVASFATDYRALPDELPNAGIVAVSDAPINALVEAYLAEVRQRVDSGKRSIATFKEARDKLGDFQGYARKYRRTTIDKVDAHLLKCYRDTQLALIDQGGVSTFTAKKRLSAVKRFLEWCYRNEFVEMLPRNPDRTFAQVELPKPEPHPFTRDEVRGLFRTALTTRNNRGHDYRNALFVAMGLNLGYRSGDIATLRHEHIRKDNGVWYVERGRQKTGSPQNHKLWEVTWELLEKEMTDPQRHELVLVDENGGPLVKEWMDRAKQDCVQQAFKRLKRRIGWKGPHRGHSCLRDTGADTLKKQFPENASVVSQYLGHMPQGVVTCYAREHYDRLFDALDWMDGYFRLKL